MRLGQKSMCGSGFPYGKSDPSRLALLIPHSLRCPAMWTLLDDLNAFLQEHRRCGEMSSGVAEGRVYMTCDGCGARLSRLLRADEVAPPPY